MKCKKCGKEHDGTFGSGKFCSRSCANSRTRSKETIEKISNSVKKWVEENPDKIKRGKDNLNFKHGLKNPMDTKYCLTCGKKFETSCYKPVDYCSVKCNPKIGGHRIGSGRGKGGWYNGIRCDSTYELVWVIYRLDHNLPVKRFEKRLENEELIYYPDFINGNTIIEIKGYYTEKVDKKCELAQSKGYEIQVLYKKDLKTEFDWVKNNYEYHYLQELYDDFKPKFNYVCSYCGKEFHAERKRRTKNVCCSRRCSVLNAKSKYDYAEHSDIMKKHYMEM